MAATVQHVTMSTNAHLVEQTAVMLTRIVQIPLGRTHAIAKPVSLVTEPPVLILTNAQQTPITVMPTPHVQIRSLHSIVHVT